MRGLCGVWKEGAQRVATKNNGHYKQGCGKQLLKNSIGHHAEDFFLQTYAKETQNRRFLFCFFFFFPFIWAKPSTHLCDEFPVVTLLLVLFRHDSASYNAICSSFDNWWEANHMPSTRLVLRIEW